MGGYLSAVIEIRDENNKRVDVSAKDGSAQPVILRTDGTVHFTSRDLGDGTTEVLMTAEGGGSGDAGPFTMVSQEVDLRSSGVTIIDTRPDWGLWKLVSIDIVRKQTMAPGGVSALVRVGSTSGGQEIVLEQSVTPSSSSILGGLALASLGPEMSQSNGFQAVYGSLQNIYVSVTVSGTPTAGSLTVYLVWQELS